MLKKVLAYSRDAATQETLRILGSRIPQANLTVTPSPEEFERERSSGGISALILDEPEMEMWLSRSKDCPETPVLLILAQASELPLAPSSHPLDRVLRKPFTSGVLLSALRELIADDPPLNNFPRVVSPATPRREDVDLDYLQEWIAEEPAIHENTSEAQLILAKEVLGADSEIDPQPTNQSKKITPSELTRENAQVVDRVSAAASPESITPNISLDDQSLDNQTLSETSEESINALEPALDTLAQDSTSVQVEYNCVLIPRDPQRFLTRGIAERLGLILPWVHASRGWQLTGISIRPQYLQWTFALSPETSPISAVREIRQLTSQQLLSTFSELQNSEADQEFWAPGYLITNGTHPIPPSMIKAFMDRTRQPLARNT